MSRPGRSRIEMDELYSEDEIQCSHCSKKFKNIFEVDKHLETDHGFDIKKREKIYVDMQIEWFQNYAPPGRWKGWWIV